jgi:hypothetical protein
MCKMNSFPCPTAIKHTHAASKCRSSTFKCVSWHTHSLPTAHHTLFYLYSYNIVSYDVSLFSSLVFLLRQPHRTHLHTAVFFSRKINNFRKHTIRCRLVQDRHQLYSLIREAMCIYLLSLPWLSVRVLFSNLTERGKISLHVMHNWRFPVHGHNLHSINQRSDTESVVQNLDSKDSRSIA